MKNAKIKAVLLTKTGQIRKSIAETRLFDALQGKKIYLYRTTGRGRFSSYSARSALPGILDSLGIRYTIGNDAPRGGLLG